MHLTALIGIDAGSYGNNASLCRSCKHACWC